jgi:MOSC domain-containing protein YiiM
MRVVSVNVGRPRHVEWTGGTALTSIWKTPVTGRVRVRALNIEGDEQSDLSVHGGREKAVYAYPSEHYAFWAEALRTLDLPWASFGENLTTEGLTEEGVSIGDRFRIGSTVLAVTQPRLPCYKLALRLGRDDIVGRFVDSDRPGFYLAVIEEGEIAAGDAIEVVARDPRGLTVRDVARLRHGRLADPALLRRAIDHPALTSGWRDHFRRRLEA